MARYTEAEMRRLYAHDEPMWFVNGDFLLTPSRVQSLIAPDLVEQVNEGGDLYRRTYADPRREAQRFSNALFRFGIYYKPALARGGK